jgi:hypothetical protein
MKGFEITCIALLVSALGCRQEDVRPSLGGELWVESSSFSDTLDFDPDFNDPSDARQYLVVRRGTEMRDGHRVPKIGSGIYEYKMNGNSISVYNLLSSCYCFSDYYYSKDKHLLIGDFYESKQPARILRFVRLR